MAREEEQVRENNVYLFVNAAGQQCIQKKEPDLLFPVLGAHQGGGKRISFFLRNMRILLQCCGAWQPGHIYALDKLLPLQTHPTAQAW